MDQADTFIWTLGHREPKRTEELTSIEQQCEVLEGSNPHTMDIYHTRYHIIILQNSTVLFFLRSQRTLFPSLRERLERKLFPCLSAREKEKEKSASNCNIRPHYFEVVCPKSVGCSRKRYYHEARGSQAEPTLWRLWVAWRSSTLAPRRPSVATCWIACSRWRPHSTRASGNALLDHGVALANLPLCKLRRASA